MALSTVALAGQWLTTGHMGIPTDVNATEERCLLCSPCFGVISKRVGEVNWVELVKRVSRLVNCWGSVVSCYCEKLVAKARDSSWTQGKETFIECRYWTTAGEDMTVDTSVCVCVVSKSPINLIMKNPPIVTWHQCNLWIRLEMALPLLFYVR